MGVAGALFGLREQCVRRGYAVCCHPARRPGFLGWEGNPEGGAWRFEVDSFHFRVTPPLSADPLDMKHWTDPLFLSSPRPRCAYAAITPRLPGLLLNCPTLRQPSDKCPGQPTIGYNVFFTKIIIASYFLAARAPRCRAPPRRLLPWCLPAPSACAWQLPGACLPDSWGACRG